MEGKAIWAISAPRAATAHTWLHFPEALVGAAHRGLSRPVPLPPTNTSTWQTWDYVMFLFHIKPKIAQYGLYPTSCEHVNHPGKQRETRTLSPEHWVACGPVQSTIPVLKKFWELQKNYRTHICKTAVLYHARHTLGNLKLHPRSVRWKGYRRSKITEICPQDIAQGLRPTVTCHL